MGHTREGKEQEVARVLGRISERDLGRMRLFDPPLPRAEIVRQLPEMHGRALEDFHATVITRAMRLWYEQERTNERLTRPGVAHGS